MMKSAFRTIDWAASLASMLDALCVMPVSSRPNLRPSLAKREK